MVHPAKHPDTLERKNKLTSELTLSALPITQESMLPYFWKEIMAPKPGLANLRERLSFTQIHKVCPQWGGHPLQCHIILVSNHPSKRPCSGDPSPRLTQCGQRHLPALEPIWVASQSRDQHVPAPRLPCHFKPENSLDLIHRRLFTFSEYKRASSLPLLPHGSLLLSFGRSSEIKLKAELPVASLLLHKTSLKMKTFTNRKTPHPSKLGS